jgi:hypothetical protein
MENKTTIYGFGGPPSERTPKPGTLAYANWVQKEKERAKAVDNSCLEITTPTLESEAALINEVALENEAPSINEPALETKAPLENEAPLINEAALIIEAASKSEAALKTEAPLEIEAPLKNEAASEIKPALLNEAALINKTPLVTKAVIPTDTPDGCRVVVEKNYMRFDKDIFAAMSLLLPSERLLYLEFIRRSYGWIPAKNVCTATNSELSAMSGIKSSATFAKAIRKLTSEGLIKRIFTAHEVNSKSIYRVYLPCETYHKESKTTLTYIP